ncbi:MAG: phosphoribosylanthranilate isomerase [Candidatus Baltobacteraceae bacterium]
MRARPTRVKFCGMTSAQEIALACEAGADAVGVILAPSERRVTLEQARALAAATPAALSFVTVLVDPSPAELAAIARELPRATLQFHGHEPAELCRSTGLPFVKVVRASEAAAADPASLLRSLAETYSGGLLMLDSGTAQRPGGTGKTFPWSIAAQAAKTLDVVVSGGLTPKNVAACVREVRPYAVDARSGVETGGRKDAEKMRAFVRAVREADAEA